MAAHSRYPLGSPGIDGRTYPETDDDVDARRRRARSPLPLLIDPRPCTAGNNAVAAARSAHSRKRIHPLLLGHCDARNSSVLGRD
jgi:hypothetical protein